jgi:hypothetical protein
MTITAPDDAAARRDALAGRLFEAALGAFDLFTIHLGDQLGLYRALAEQGPMRPPELATAAGIAPRYAREWLEQQAVTGLLDVDDANAAPDARRYALPAGYAEVLVDPTSTSLMAPIAQWVVAGGASMADLVEAYRTGGGVAWDRYQDVVVAQDRSNRPQFLHSLTQDWLPALGDIDARLRAQGGRIADVACGTGWSTIALARGYEKATVDGLDLDAGSIATANDRLATDAPELADRVTFQARDAGDPQLAGRYDLALILEALHDMAHPVEVLAAVRGLLATRSSASCTATAHCSACRTRWRRRVRSEPVPCCGRIGCGSSPSRPGIRRSRSCPSSTTRSGSTASIPSATSRCNAESAGSYSRAGFLREEHLASERQRVPSSRGQSRAVPAARR